MSPPNASAAKNATVTEKINLYSVRRLESLLGFTRADLWRVAATAGRYYKPFFKKEVPRPFQKKIKPRKARKIDNPTGELKTIQKNIYTRILKRIPLPENIMGGVSGCAISDNARVHLGGKVLAKIDIRSFFPSVT